VGADLSFSSWVGASLGGADLGFASAVGADFAGAALTGVGLRSADLERAALVGADLTGAVDASGVAAVRSDWTGADATGMSLRAADLRDAVLVDAVLRGVDLTLADLGGVDARCADAVADPPVDPVALDTCAELHGATLRFARAVDADFGHALLVEGPGAVPVDLRDAELRRADFSDACFTAVVAGSCEPLPPVSPAPAMLAGARVDGVRFDRAVLVGSDLRRIAGGCVEAGPGDPDPSDRCPSFVAVDLRMADLSGARLADADFTGADLAGATATGADWAAADLTDASLVGAVLDDVVLDGAIVDGADLTNAVLTGADLTDARFVGATFADGGVTTIVNGLAQCTPGPGETPVDLTGAVLVGADLVSAESFQAGCILVDTTTLYDDETTGFPTGFALRSQMTNVPEPSGPLAAFAAGAALSWLARRRATGPAR
jgi:uncharacterized protein YjbI with pentapeptide repeats